MTRNLSFSLVFAVTTLAAGCGASAERGSTEPSVAASRSPAFLRDEEKLARDVYRHLQARYDHPPFAHIAGCEQRHLEAMTALAGAPGAAGSETPDVAGRFADPELQALYDRLIASGDASLEAALAVGALVEETDIADLQRALSNAPSADAQAVYQRLLNASHNHLRAFHRNLAARNVSYTPQVLARAEFDAIVAGASGCGQGGGQGGGRGRGHGGGRPCDGRCAAGR
jgi:hypothetical protein